MKKKMSTRKMVYLAMLAAVSAALMYLEIPLPFLPPFLKLDISGVPILIGSFMFGPVGGIFITLVKDLVHLLSSQTGGVGELADFILFSVFSVAAGLIYMKNRTKKGAILGCAVGTVCMVAAGALTNYYLLIPFYARIMPLEAIIGACQAVNPNIDSLGMYILYGVVPFNLIKAAVLSLLTFFTYKRIEKLLKIPARGE